MHGSRLGHHVAIIAIASIGLMAACDSNEPITDSTDSGGSYRLEPISGDAQASETQTELAEPFVVRALDAQERPVAGVMVHWVVRDGDGRTPAESSVTDNEGLASAMYTLGPEPGENRVEARTSDPGIVVTFRAGAFPVSPESAEVFVREETEPSGAFSRYVLLDGETFEFQRSLRRHGYSTSEGTYSRAGAELTFRFGSGAWYAQGELSSGRLDVTYPIDMLLDGFSNGVYVLTKSCADNCEPPVDSGEYPQHLDSDTV